MRARSVWVSVVLLGCASGVRAAPPVSRADDVAARVAAVHGGAGPFAVAGYRMGERALHEVNVARGSFSAEVVHEAPSEVQWTCIVDGLQAATGTSLGRLNLHLVEAPRESMRTVVRNRDQHTQVEMRLRPAFLQRYLETPRERLGAAGREVAVMPDEEIFEVVRPAPAPTP